MHHYHSLASLNFARVLKERQVAERAHHAGRQLAHDTSASARAAKKRAAKRHEIASRPRGQTTIIGQRADGRPIHRAIPAFRARPYTPPEQRKERPAPSTAHGAAAALKAATESNRRVWHKAMDANHQGDYELQRAARKARMAAKRRRGW